MRSFKSAVLPLAALVAITLLATSPGVAAPGIAAAVKDARAVDVMRAAGRALDEAGVVEYDFEYIGTLTGRGHASGHAVVGNAPDVWTMRYLADVRLGDAAGFESYPTSFTLGSDGETVWLLDHDERVAHTGTSRMESFNILRGSSFFTTPHPTRPHGNRFGVEIDDTTVVRYIGTSTLDGIETDVVYLEFPTDSMLGEQYLYFGREDHLLRRAVVVSLDPAAPETAYHSTITFRNVRTLQGDEVPSFVPAVDADYRVNEIDAMLVSEGVSAPDWTLTAIDGTEMRLSDHRGEVVVLEFFASWCPICRAAMPVTQQLSEEFADQPVRFLAINAYETGDVERFVEEVGVHYPVLVGGDFVADRYVVVHTPTTFVVAPDGVVIYREGGNPPGRAETLRSVIRGALDR